MSFKMDFNADRFMKDLERDIRKSVEDDIAAHPEKILSHHLGERINGKCPNCGCKEIEVLRAGKGRCSQCGKVSNIQLDPKWR